MTEKPPITRGFHTFLKHAKKLSELIGERGTSLPIHLFWVLGVKCLGEKLLVRRFSELRRKGWIFVDRQDVVLPTREEMIRACIVEGEDCWDVTDTQLRTLANYWKDGERELTLLHFDDSPRTLAGARRLAEQYGQTNRLTALSPPEDLFLPYEPPPVAPPSLRNLPRT